MKQSQRRQEEEIKGMVLELTSGFPLKRKETLHFCDRGKENEWVKMKIIFVAEGWASEASALLARKRQSYVLLEMKRPGPSLGLKDNYVHAVHNYLYVQHVRGRWLWINRSINEWSLGFSQQRDLCVCNGTSLFRKKPEWKSIDIFHSTESRVALPKWVQWTDRSEASGVCWWDGANTRKRYQEEGAGQWEDEPERAGETWNWAIRI